MRALRLFFVILLITGLLVGQSIASTRLTYERLPEGFMWNLANKIHRVIGYWPTISKTSCCTYIWFAEDLTPEEIDVVNGFMADLYTAQDPDSGAPGNLYVIKDIWEWRAELEALTGHNFGITYRSSCQFGCDVYDEIVLKPMEADGITEYILTPNERNEVSNIIKSNFGGWE